MKTASVAGIILIVLGVLALAYQGISYTKREHVVDVGPIHASRERHETIPLPPVLDGAAVIGGIVLLIIGQRKK